MLTTCWSNSTVPSWTQQVANINPDSLDMKGYGWQPFGPNDAGRDVPSWVQQVVKIAHASLEPNGHLGQTKREVVLTTCWSNSAAPIWTQQVVTISPAHSIRDLQCVACKKCIVAVGLHAINAMSQFEQRKRCKPFVNRWKPPAGTCKPLNQ